MMPDSARFLRGARDVRLPANLVNLGSGLPEFTNPSLPFSCTPRTVPWLFILADFWVKQPFALLAEQFFLRLNLASYPSEQLRLCHRR